MKQLPEAFIGHQSPGRIRFRIAAQKGDTDYFAKLEALVQSRFDTTTVSVNPLTGSLLVAGDDVDAIMVADHCAESGLFKLIPEGRRRVPLAQSIAEPIFSASEKIGKVTDGYIDMPGLIFLSALMFGAYEIIRGNFRTPPWYTAFWYAFGIYTKSYWDKKSGHTDNT